jgi:hypothetical protein
MATRVHRPLKLIAFNANGISRQRHESIKLLQHQKRCGPTLRDTSQNSKGSVFQNTTSIEQTANRVERAEL